MANIELVIKIPEELYKANHRGLEAEELWDLRIAIKNCTMLPKGHGRLIDADAFIATMEDASKRQKYKKLLIDDILTVDDVFKAIIESLQNKGLAEGDSPTIIETDNSVYSKENEIDDTFNKLLSLDNHYLEVSKDIDGNICVRYKDAWIDDVYCFKGVVGRGKTLAEAANNYCKLISGKTIVFLNENNREEVKVLF